MKFGLQIRKLLASERDYHKSRVSSLPTNNRHGGGGWVGGASQDSLRIGVWEPDRWSNSFSPPSHLCANVQGVS